MAKIFRKRSGTTNKGIDYEILNIANIVIDLVSDGKIQDFHISSNDEDFGAFDDVVVETKTENGTEICALQLKHSDRGNLSVKHLTQPTGNFSLKKYFDSVQTLQVNQAKFILCTNLKFNIEEGTKFRLDGEKFLITPTKIVFDNAFKISQKSDHCYTFSIVKDHNYENCSNAKLYETFFQNFFLYADQENCFNLKHLVTEKFKTVFLGNDLECDHFVNFLNEWGAQEGIKEKLNKEYMKTAIALKVLSFRVKSLSFNQNSAQTDIDSGEIVRQNILREAIEAFDVTIFGKQSYDGVKILWNHAASEIDLKTINKLRKKFQPASTNISDIAKVESLTLSILLWLLGKCPLILTQDSSVHKVLELCTGKKIILLKDDCGNSFTGDNCVFETLADLKTKTFQFDQLVENFMCSLQGKKDICLKILIHDSEKILNLLTTDDLLKMVKSVCSIGTVKENLPDPYIERCLLKNAIDSKMLDNISTDTVIILDCVSDKNKLENILRRHNLVNIHDYLNPEEDQTASLNINSGFDKELSTECSSVGTKIYLSEKRCEYSEFIAVCTNIKNVHQFRVRDDENFEWIRSKGDVNDLEKYKLSEYYPIQESDLSSSGFANKINLLVSDPGMGKTELMKSFKLKRFSERFTVIVDPKDVHSVLKDTHESNNYVDIFQKFLLREKCKTFSDRDKEIFSICLKKNKIIYVWDAIDELSDKHREIVTDVVVELSKNCVQWVTSRCHLQAMLQRKFNVLSLNLNKFGKEEQRRYIHKRLIDESSKRNIQTIIEKIESSFALVEHKDILGIPLQIFMLTELFRQDREKYLDLLNDSFLLTDLYMYFIEQKINIYYTEKLGLDLNKASAEKLIEDHRDKLLLEYTNAALRLLFLDTTLSKLAIQNKDNFPEIRESHTILGLVTEVKDQIPRFLHNSFAEYLAARYFVANRQHKKILEPVLFDQKYNNVRFFFDLILARDSKAHIAILYRDFNFIKSCDSENLSKTDYGGRTVLHLACSWGQRYPELKVKHVLMRGTYVIDDEGMLRTTPESKEYLEIIDILLEMCNISKSDHIYNMTPREYAQRTTCIVAEMRVMMQEGIKLLSSFTTYHLINMIYYSVCSGYYHEFIYFFEIFKERKLFRKAADSVKNKTGNTLLYIANIMGHVKIVQFLIIEGADVRLAGQSLTMASINGNYTIVEFIVRAGADINLKDVFGVTPLNGACLNGHYRIVELLVKSGADLNLADKNGNTPLKLASSNGHDKIAGFLVESGADINRANNGGVTPLNETSEKGHTKIAGMLVKAGANINIPDKYGSTPLHAAVTNLNEPILSLLLQAGAEVGSVEKCAMSLIKAIETGKNKIFDFLVKEGTDINLADLSGFTPLQSACSNGRYKFVQLLDKAGADINLADKHGNTPLKLACSKGHEEIAAFLVEAGADVNLANKDGVTPLNEASEKGHTKIVEILVRAGADINLPDKYGCTPLNAASTNDDDETVELLLRAGAKIYSADRRTTLLVRAAERGNDKIVEHLLEAGPDVNLVDLWGVTPLNAACSNGHYRIVELLVKAGADVNLADKYGKTPLKLASSNNHDTISGFLVQAGADVNLANESGLT